MNGKKGSGERAKMRNKKLKQTARNVDIRYSS